MTYMIGGDFTFTLLSNKHDVPTTKSDMYKSILRWNTTIISGNFVQHSVQHMFCTTSTVKPQCPSKPVFSA